MATKKENKRPKKSAEKPAKKKRLTAREKLFVELYSIYLNGARAARESGYTERSARQTAVLLLSKSYIQDYLAICQRHDVEYRERLRWAIIKELEMIAFSRSHDVCKLSNGRVEVLKDDEINGALIESVGETLTGLKLKLHSKEGAF